MWLRFLGPKQDRVCESSGSGVIMKSQNFQEARDVPRVKGVRASERPDLRTLWCSHTRPEVLVFTIISDSPDTLAQVPILC